MHSKRFGHYFAALLGAVLINACTSVDPREPKELQPVQTEVKLKSLWKIQVGTGDDEKQLQLRPAFIADKAYTIDIDGNLRITDLAKGKAETRHYLNERVSSGFGHDAQRLYYATFDGELVALDLESLQQLWRVRITSEALAPPVSNGAHVTVQTIDGKVASFDASSGKQLWRHDSLDPILTLRGTAAPLYVKDMVLVSFANGELLAFDDATGLVRWKAIVGLPQGRTELERLVDVDGAPVATDDKLFAVAYQGKLLALDLSRGFELWSRPVSSFNQVAVDANKVYVADSDGVVTAQAQHSGEVLWSNDALQYRRLASPVLFGETVVVSDFEGYLHFLARDDGRIVARRRVLGDGPMGPLVVRDGKLYVMTRSGDLYCYEYPK